MSINIQAKTNYSFLFSGLSSSASNALSGNWLADYASINTHHSHLRVNCFESAFQPLVLLYQLQYTTYFGFFQGLLTVF